MSNRPQTPSRQSTTPANLQPHKSQLLALRLGTADEGSNDGNLKPASPMTRSLLSLYYKGLQRAGYKPYEPQELSPFDTPTSRLGSRSALKGNPGLPQKRGCTYRSGEGPPDPAIRFLAPELYDLQSKGSSPKMPYSHNYTEPHMSRGELCDWYFKEAAKYQGAPLHTGTQSGDGGRSVNRGKRAMVEDEENQEPHGTSKRARLHHPSPTTSSNTNSSISSHPPQVHPLGAHPVKLYSWTHPRNGI
ncbi:hypothetical protein F5Y11DRAFT_366512 [Daldinia sp. FL1419]|nr:hypothetical protein F5Y11DRAFT_366512 [Daldinia sp. FL1419]